MKAILHFNRGYKHVLGVLRSVLHAISAQEQGHEHKGDGS